MKTTLGNVRRLIKESLLLEARCPVCGADGAYVGLNNVECQNPKCKLFVKPTGTKKPMTVTIDYGGWGGVGVNLDNGRYLDENELMDALEHVVSYDDYLDDPTRKDDPDDGWALFAAHAFQRALETAGVTEVIDTESHFDGPISIEEYGENLEQLEPALKKMFELAIPEIDRYVAGL